MPEVRTACTAAALSVLSVLGACSGDDAPSSAAPETTASPATGQGATTTAPVGTSTTKSADVLRAALLTPADIPGSRPLTGLPAEVDLSACVPNNPFAFKSDPNEIKAPGIRSGDGASERRYVVKVRQGTAEQAKGFVAALGTPAGSACVTEVYKAGVASVSSRADVSALTGSATTAPVGETGTLVTITGKVTSEGQATDIRIDVLVFQKGAAVVFLSVLGGPSGGTETLDLARKVDGRIS